MCLDLHFATVNALAFSNIVLYLNLGSSIDTDQIVNVILIFDRNFNFADFFIFLYQISDRWLNLNVKNKTTWKLIVLDEFSN